MTKGLPEVTHVQAITVHPANQDVVYLGTRCPVPQHGPRRALGAAGLPQDLEVWSILVHPGQPRVLFAGTSPVGIWRSDDGGDSWRRLPRRSSPIGSR